MVTKGNREQKRKEKRGFGELPKRKDEEGTRAAWFHRRDLKLRLFKRKIESLGGRRRHGRASCGGGLQG